MCFCFAILVRYKIENIGKIRSLMSGQARWEMAVHLLSLMGSYFVLSFIPCDVLNEIWDLIDNEAFQNGVYFQEINSR